MKKALQNRTLYVVYDWRRDEYCDGYEIVVTFNLRQETDGSGKDKSGISDEIYNKISGDLENLFARRNYHSLRTGIARYLNEGFNRIDLHAGSDALLVNSNRVVF